MLTHTEQFSDQWSIKSVAGNEHLLKSLTISGSAGGDGTFPGGLGIQINLVVNGANWRLTMEFLELLGGGPGVAGVAPQIRRSVQFDLADGLVRTFSDIAGGLPFDEGVPVLVCKNLDPKVNPFAGAVNPYNFTIDPKMLRHRRPYPAARSLPK